MYRVRSYSQSVWTLQAEQHRVGAATSYGKGVALIEIADGKVTRVQNVDLYGIEDDQNS